MRVRRAGWYHGGEASAFLLADGPPFEPRGGPFVVRGSGTLRGRCTMSIQHVEHMKASLARRAKEAGLTVQEVDAQLQARADRQRVEREATEEAERAQVAEALAFARGITDEHGLPAAYAVARELTQRHLGGRPVKLVDLLLEAGLAATQEDAAWVCKAQVGRDLTAELHALQWTRKRRGTGYWWAPPRAAEVE